MFIIGEDLDVGVKLFDLIDSHFVVGGEGLTNVGVTIVSTFCRLPEAERRIMSLLLKVDRQEDHTRTSVPRY